jgi:WD40 repeat protein
MPESAGSRAYGRFDELAEEFAERYRRGDRPSVEEYVSRLPEMADEIREIFPALIEVEQVERDAREDARPQRPVIPLLKDLGDYRIVREIGRGGMGVGYEAEQISLGRRVALKVLPGHVGSNRKALERFRREAKAAARLHHTNIVPVFEVGHQGEFAFYAMQFIQGQGLDQVIDELTRLRTPDLRPVGKAPHRDGSARPLSPSPTIPGAPESGARGRELGEVAESVLSGRLATEVPQSSSGIDPGPALFAWAEPPDLDATIPADARHLTQTFREGRPRAEVTSAAMLPGGTAVSSVESSNRRQPFFRSVAQIGRQAAQGLAYAHSRGIVHRDIKPSNLLLDISGIVWITDFGLAKAEEDGLTATGDVLGTFRYMAPERFRGEGDARADIYALGLTLYELLTLKPAYESNDRLKLMERIKAEDPPRPRFLDGRIPRDLETIVLKAVDKDPAQRYPSAEAMGEDLRRFLADEPIKARQASAAERYWRWARRNPAIAVLGGVLTALLVVATVGSLVAAGRFARMADRERLAREQANRQARAESIARAEAVLARDAAEKARAVAQAETYRATLSEVKALRAGRQLGWREVALAKLARLAIMPDPHRDRVELRTEAVACIGEFGVREVARFKISGEIAYSLHFSPDSRTLVTASDAGHLELWDVAARKNSARLPSVARSHDGAMGNGGLVRFLPSGDLVLLSSSNHVAFLGLMGRQSPRPAIERGPVRARKLEVDLQGRRLAVGWDDGRIDVYDVATGALRQSFDWEKPWDFTFSPDGQWLAFQVRDGPIRLVPIGGKTGAFTLGSRSGHFAALAFSPDGTAIAGIDGRSAVVWHLASRQELLRLSGHKESVTAIAFSPDGALVATTCGDSMTRIWDARDGRALAALPGPWYMRRLAFSPDGTYLAASADPGPVCLYQFEGRREHRRLVGHNFGSLAVAFHPRLPRLASSSDDHAIIIWDVDEARPVRRWTAHNRQVTGLAYNPDGSLLASACGASNANERTADDHAIHLWDAEDGTLSKRLPRSSRSGVWRLAFDPTGRRLASGDDGGTALLWDLGESRTILCEREGIAPVSAVVFHNGGRELIVAREHGKVALWDLEHPGPPRCIQLPDGCKRLVLDSRRSRVVIGDLAGGLVALSLPDLTVVRRRAKEHSGAIASLSLGADGRLLATSGMDLRVVLRDAATFEPLLAFPAWVGVVRDLAFDPSGRWLAFAGADSDLSLWDLNAVRDELAGMGLAWEAIASTPASRADQPALRERSQHPVSGSTVAR